MIDEVEMIFIFEMCYLDSQSDRGQLVKILIHARLNIMRYCSIYLVVLTVVNQNFQVLSRILGHAKFYLNFH